MNDVFIHRGSIAKVDGSRCGRPRFGVDTTVPDRIQHFEVDEVLPRDLSRDLGKRVWLDLADNIR